MSFGYNPEDDDESDRFYSIEIYDDTGELMWEDIVEAYDEDLAIKEAQKQSGLDSTEYEYQVKWLEDYASEKDIDRDGDAERE